MRGASRIAATEQEQQLPMVITVSTMTGAGIAASLTTYTSYHGNVQDAKKLALVIVMSIIEYVQLSSSHCHRLNPSGQLCHRAFLFPISYPPIRAIIIHKFVRAPVYVSLVISFPDGHSHLDHIAALLCCRLCSFTTKLLD